MGKDIQARIGKEFNNEIEEIKDKRLRNGLDKTRRSTSSLTNLITKHSYWQKIKEEAIGLIIKEENRNGN